jgi:hypothetical protein
MTRVTTFAVVGWLATLAIGVSALGLRIVRPDPIAANMFGMGEAGMVAFVILGIAWSTVGALLMVRRPGNLVGWVVLFVGAGYALSILSAAVTSSAVVAGPSGSRLASVAGWITGLGTLMGGGVFYLAVIFPTGRGHTARWTRTGHVILGCTVATSVALLIQPGPLHLYPSIDNPFGVGPDLRPLFAGRMGSLIALGVAAFSPVLVAALASRYRAASATERVQLRWFVASIVLTMSSLIVVAFAGLAGPDLLGELPLVVFALAGTTVPLAIGIAILRHHLYDIDRIISRSIGWATVTGVLVAVFAVAVIGLQTALSTVTQGQTLAVAASTLVAFALFQPLRRRIQRAVDRRFDRGRYDAQRTADGFAERVRNEVDLPRITDALLATSTVTVRPVGATVWLRSSGEPSR